MTKTEVPEGKKFRWIREDIVLTAPMTKVLENTIKEAEELDIKGDTEFFCVAEILDVIGKGMVASGKWSEKDWDMLCMKYPIEV